MILLLAPIIHAGPKILVVTDIHYGAQNIEEDGHDSSPAFLTITLKKMEQLSKQVDAIITLGDFPSHMVYLNFRKEEYLSTLFEGLYKSDVYLKPMFYIFGNNDSLGGNYQPFEVEGKTPLSFAKHWQGACLYCADLLIDKSPMAHKGYYSSYVQRNNKELVLIALNSAPFAKLPLFIWKYPRQKAEAQEEFIWLEQQLKQLKAKQLLIAMHVPPGSTYKGGAFWNEYSLKRFTDLLNKYSSRFEQITLLTGHTHMDEIRKIPLRSGNTNIYAFSTPGISRNHHNNPGMKIYSFNDAMALTNYTTYYTAKLHSWADDHYDAMGAVNSIFPNCASSNLAQCLDSMTRKEVCERLEQGLFYGVKSGRVPANVCNTTYLNKM